jgi:hypothetical protein
MRPALPEQYLTSGTEHIGQMILIHFSQDVYEIGECVDSSPTKDIQQGFSSFELIRAVVFNGGQMFRCYAGSRYQFVQ